MQPHEGTKSAAGLSRARMFIRSDLGWMQGFPLGAGGWLQVGDGSAAVPVALDRERLRTSVYTIAMLRRDFPRALPRVVGDVERWTRTHHALLDVLKPTIHDGAPLPASPLGHHPYAGRALLQAAQRLEREAPQLQTWRTAFEWYGWTDLTALRAALAWLAEQAVVLTRLRDHLTDDDPLLAVRLWQLTRAHSARRVAPLIALLADDALWQAPLECPENYLPQIRAASKRETLGAVTTPEAILPRRLISWVGWLGEQEAVPQRRGLELLAMLLPAEMLAPWPTWWSKLASRLRLLRRATKAERPQMLTKLERWQQRAPPAMPAKRLERVLREVTTSSTEPLYRVAAKALSQVPAIAQGCALRLELTNHWLLLWQRADEHQRSTLLRYVPAFVHYAAPLLPHAEGLAPWQGLWAGAPHTAIEVDEHALERLQERRAMTAYFQVLRSAVVSSRGEARLLCALAADLPSQRVEAVFAQLRGSALAHEYAYVGRTSMRFCHELTVAHPEAFAPLLVVIEAPNDVDGCVRLLRPVAGSFAAANLTGMLIDALVDDAFPAIVASARKLAFTLAQGVPAPRIWQTVGRPPWIDTYPTTLHAALAALAQYDPAAESSAAKALAKDFPERRALERELARLHAIEQPTRSQQARLTSLTTRLTAPRSLSAQRLVTLEVKLRALVRRRVIEHWQQAVDAAFRSAFQSYLGVACSPEWIAAPEVTTTIAAMADLPPASQALARRVLAKRAGPAPWDLRDAPANRACIVALRTRGIKLEPWLDDTTLTEYTTAEGQLLRLSLERDPLALLSMGGHFGTCLSPGHCNFFSVFANIADVNKQVLYARTATGTVFGRVLLALTGAGGLLTFHRYSHGSQASFTTVVKDYVHTLARRMNTLVVDSGPVATLVADRWYDDGSVDLAQTIPAFESGSPLRLALPSLPSTALVTTLTEALAPLPVNELTLPYVLALPELAARTDLLLALLPLIERTPLGLSTLLDVVRKLEGTPGVPLASLLEQIFQRARRVASDRFSYDLGHLLAEHAPVLALRWLRETREREVRRWDDEEDDRRLFIAARAAEKLRRRRQAKWLYERVLARSIYGRFQEESRAAIERLG